MDINLGLTYPWLVSYQLYKPLPYVLFPPRPLRVASQDNFEKIWGKLLVSLGLVFFLGWKASFPAIFGDMALGSPNPRWGLRPLWMQDWWCFVLGELEITINVHKKLNWRCGQLRNWFSDWTFMRHFYISFQVQCLSFPFCTEMPCNHSDW